MSAIKSAVCLVKTTADGTETEESYHADEANALCALAVQCRECGWSVTDLIAGEAPVRMLGY